MTITTTIETIIITRNNTTFELNKVNSKECEINKLNKAWNNYNKDRNTLKIMKQILISQVISME